MGIALTNGNKICVMGNGVLPKIKPFIDNKRFDDVENLENNGEKIYFEDNKQENSEVQSPN